MTSPYLTAAEAAAYLGKTPMAFRAFLSRRRKAGRPIRCKRIGSLLRFTVADLEAAMTVEDGPRSLRRSA